MEDRAHDTTDQADGTDEAAAPPTPPVPPVPMPVEIGGPKGPEPTRYGDWERKGRCFDF